ncbi:MAG TPA: hypothetical protein VNE39_25605 [Planctomycetota bacterium]|nr:hypothetical protein [Planctomycetota bacterium]
MRQNCVWTLLGAAVLTLACAGIALGGAPDASLAGPTRGGLDLALPYMQTGRGAGMGGAGVALDGSSQNPAALGFMKGFSIGGGFGAASFDNGPDVAMYNSQVIFPMPFLGGTSKIMGYHLKTTDRDVSRMMGMEAEVWATQYGMAYGRQIPLRGILPGKLAIGFAGYPNDPSEIWLRDPATGATFAHGRGISKVGSIRLGFLYKPTDLINLGGEFTHIKDRLYATYPGLPGAPSFKSNYHVNLYTVGAAARLGHRGLLGRTTVAIQYLGGHANGQGVDQAYVVWAGGVEHRIPITETIGIALRGGYYARSPTYGVGITLPYRLTFDYAYIPNYGDNLAKAFGHGALHSFGLSKAF